MSQACLQHYFLNNRYLLQLRSCPPTLELYCDQIIVDYFRQIPSCCINLCFPTGVNTPLAIQEAFSYNSFYLTVLRPLSNGWARNVLIKHSKSTLSTLMIHKTECDYQIWMSDFFNHMNIRTLFVKNFTVITPYEPREHNFALHKYNFVNLCVRGNVFNNILVGHDRRLSELHLYSSIQHPLIFTAALYS